MTSDVYLFASDLRVGMRAVALRTHAVVPGRGVLADGARAAGALQHRALVQVHARARAARVLRRAHARVPARRVAAHLVRAARVRALTLIHVWQNKTNN